MKESSDHMLAIIDVQSDQHTLMGSPRLEYHFGYFRCPGC